MSTALQTWDGSAWQTPTLQYWNGTAWVTANITSGVSTLSAPGAPTNVTAEAWDAQATVSFTPPISDGGTAITAYTITAVDQTNSANGGQTATGTTSPINILGLTDGDTYTLTVTATNSQGTGPASTASNAVTPTLEVTSSTPVVLADTAWLGIHYMPSPSVTMRGAPAKINSDQTQTTAIGASSWQVLDSRGNIVANGTCNPTDTSFQVANNGTWVNGGTMVPGHYTATTNTDGTYGPASGTIMICPANSNLYVPNTTANSPLAASAWMSSGVDRDYYNVLNSSDAGGTTPSAVISNLQSDPYFTGPQDSARPHRMWLAPQVQASAPTQDPSPTTYASYATALQAAGYTGIHWEAPTNEPENGGWSLSEVISYFNECQQAILAVDPTAQVMGWDCNGMYNNSNLSTLATFLESCTPAAFTNHMEASNQNMHNIVALRQYFGGIKNQFAASGVPDLDYWNTETGILGAGYGVMQPRREARQRTILRFVAESYGFCKENQYDFEVWDHHGSGLPMFLIDGFNADNGNARAGIYAIHVMSEALYGTSCTPSNPPTSLSFGPTGGLGDSMFAGLHYNGTTQDVVVLATNDLESAEITLNVSATGSITYWDGMGVPGTVTVTGGQITIPVDDLLTYVFLPKNTTVSVAPAWWSGLSDVLTGLTVKNESNVTATAVNNGSFAENNSGVTGSSTPYIDTTVPGTLTVTTTEAAQGFALMTAGEAWEGWGCSIVDFTLTANGEEIYHYTNPTAISRVLPSPSIGNTSDPANLITFWTAPTSYLVEVPIPAGEIVLTINKTGYGGQPDSLGANNPTNSYHEGDAMKIQLTEWQLLG